MPTSPFMFSFEPGYPPDETPINPEVGGISRHGFVVLPNDILNYMQKVNAAMGSLDADINKSALPQSDSSFVAAWANFLTGWKKFYADHQPFYMRLSGSVYDTTEDYETNLDQWRASFVARGGTPSAPRSGKDQPDVAGALKWGAAAVIAAALAYGVYKVAK